MWEKIESGNGISNSSKTVSWDTIKRVPKVSNDYGKSGFGAVAAEPKSNKKANKLVMF